MMHIVNTLFEQAFKLIFLFGICFNLNLSAQTMSDSARVTGQLIWRDNRIIGFPPKIKITSLSNPALDYQASVDSLGRYTLNLPIGSYKAKSNKYYHWMDEEFIRIDDNSEILFDVKSEHSVSAPVLELKTILKPDLIPEKGVLFDFDHEKSIELDEFIKTYMSFYKIPGASLALIKNGEVIYRKAFGVKNSVSKKPVSTKTLFAAGSLTKPAFAFVVMRLVEKGVLDLDEPLYRYLPFQDVAHDNRYKLITARHVLCHQTGFPNWATRDKNGHFELEFTPGTRFGYSGEGYEYLKRVVEHITKKNIATILKEELLKPLKWKGVYFQESGRVEKLASNGHINNAPKPIRLTKEPMMAYSMHTEAKSFSNFMIALMKRKGLKPSSFNEMLKVQTTVAEGVYWGLGFCIEDSPMGHIIRHGGSTVDFICNFSYFEDLNLGFVMFTNNDMGEWLSIPLLTEYLITGKPKKNND